jgi:hypothetical protein
MDRHRYGSCALARAAPANEDGPRPFVPLARPVMAFLHSASLNQLSDGGFVFHGRERGEPMLELPKNMGRTSRCREHIQHLVRGGNKFFQLGGRILHRTCARRRGREGLSAPFNARKAQADHGVLAAFAAKQQAKVISIKTGSRPDGSVADDGHGKPLVSFGSRLTSSAKLPPKGLDRDC